MKFHVAVVQCNGEVTDRNDRTSDQVRRAVIGRQLVNAFDGMLDEHLSKLALGEIVSVRCPLFEDQRGAIEWRQPEPFSAMAAFEIERKLKFLWLYLAGHEPASDAIAVRAAEELVNNVASDAGLKVPGIKLHLLKERPLAVCVPWPQTPSERDRRIVGNYAVCLGLAFFEKIDSILSLEKALFPPKPAGFAGWGFRYSEN